MKRNRPWIKITSLALEGIHVPEAALRVGESSENIWRTQLARSERMVKLGFTSVLDMKIR